MLNIYDGTSWVTVDKPLVWDGTSWTHRGIQYWDGLEWQNQAVLSTNYSASTALSWDVAGPTVPPKPPTQTYTGTKAFAAVWSGSYQADGDLRTDSPYLYQGYNSYGASNGNQRSLAGFAFTGFPAGATCVSATLSLYANHWYNNSGGTAVIGSHNSSSRPGSFPAGTNDDRVRYAWNTKTGQRSIALPVAMGQEFIAGTSKGILLGPGPATTNTYYGYFENAGSYRPTITVKYTWVA